MSFVWGVTAPEGEVVDMTATSSNIEQPVQSGEGSGGSETNDVCLTGGICIPPDIYFILVVIAAVIATAAALKYGLKVI